MRRINHRMASLQVGTLTDYYSMIKNSPKELDILFETVLIGVTEFFRDEKSFKNLSKHLKKMLKDKKPGDSIRMWSVGCATGEEPYSVAILLHELLGHDITRFNVTIFASDIDERALNYGRKGLYRQETLKNLDDAIIDKYFTKHGTTHYEVNKEIKQHVLFSRHDISNDPPFVKLDLITCRNLLIYFNNDLQKQSFQIFHYALKPQGLLFLGKSESVSLVSDLFKKSGNFKVFEKADSTLSYELRFSRFKRLKATANGDPTDTKKRNMSIIDVAKETLYYKYQYPFVIINELAEIKEVNGSLRLYLEISQGTMNANLFKMANEELIIVLKAVLAQVKKTKVQHLSHVIKFTLYDNIHYVRVRIAPLIYTIQELQYYIVVFEKVDPSEQVLELQKKLETSDYVDLRIKELEDELATNREHLQIFTEELEATNEELQTINEELQSANEELKSSNEELETSNEELQSANEELNTANHELRITNDALILKEKQLNEEKEISSRNELIYKTIAENIPNGTVGILNEHCEIEYVTGQGLKEFTVEEMIGKNWYEMNPSKTESQKLEKLCASTLEGKGGSLQTYYKGEYHEINTLPISMPGSNERKMLYLTQEVTKSERNQLILDTALRASKIIVFEYDFKEDVVKPNDAFSDFLEIDHDDLIREEDIKKLIHPEDNAQRAADMEAARKTGKLNHEVRLVLPNQIKFVRVTGEVVFDEDRNPETAFIAMLDISKDRELLLQIKESEQRFKNIADAAPLTIWMTDENMSFIYANKTWIDFTGKTLEENSGDGFFNQIHKDDLNSFKNKFKQSFKNKSSFTEEFRARAIDGSFYWFLTKGIPIFDKDENFKGYIGSSTDITNQKLFTQQLEEKVDERTLKLQQANDALITANMNLEEYAYVASYDLQEPLRKIRMFNSILIENKEDETQLQQYTQKIEALSQRMTELIKGILVFGELSKSNKNLENVNLEKTLADVKGDLEEIITEKNVTIKTNELGTVHANAIYMYQLFSNLIRNSIKFNNEIPKINITSNVVDREELDITTSRSDAQTYRVIEFKDNGIGIDNNNFNTIFKPFKRLHSKSEFPGTGIGLAICKRIVEMHNGEIRMKENDKEKGTTFIIYLPLK